MFKITFFKNSFRNTIRVSNGLDSDQDRRSVGPGLGLNCLQRCLTQHQMWRLCNGVKFFRLFQSSAYFVQNYPFQKILLGNTIRVSNGKDPDQDRRSVGPDLGLNCLQRCLNHDHMWRLCNGIKFSGFFVVC